MDWIDEEAGARSADQTGSREIWRQNLSRLAALELPAGDARTLARACREPADLALLVRVLQSDPEDGDPPVMRARYLIRQVDESDLPLAEWIAAMSVFYRWLDTEKRRTSLPKALGYIHCCAEGMSSGIAFASLSDGVDDMLTAYGFEGTDGGDDDAQRSPNGT